MALKLPVPTNLITGYLGAGKTTAILDLLRNHSTGKRWAVLVNEFGEVALDHLMLQSSGVEGLYIRELAGGCICCTLSLPLQAAITHLIREAKPDHLLIESTGAGHPAGVLDTLRGKEFQTILDVRATVCLVDPRDVTIPYCVASPVFQDQIHMADVAVVNKADLVDAATIDQATAWLRNLFPPKLLVASTQGGRLDPAWLDLAADPLRTPLFPDVHPPGPQPRESPLGPAVLAPGQPYRQRSDGFDHHACGWIFSPQDVFDEEKLLGLVLGGYKAKRLKGVFRIGPRDWMLVNRAGEEVVVESIAYRRDSRLEVFAETANPDWDKFEQALLDCLRTDVPAEEK